MAALILAFGLLIPGLGFYYDDWHFIYYATRGNQGLIDIFNYDGHPTAVWIYMLAFRLVGYSPLLWHILALFLRWLAVAAFWLCFRTVWPRYNQQTITAALLFAIYPFFTLQALPISYFEVWLGFFLLGLSFYFTLSSILHPEKFWLFATLAILAKIGNAFTSEYTWGTELMRPFLIWFVLAGGLSARQKLWATLKYWAPYLLIFIGMIGWRAFFYAGGRKAFQAQTGMLSSPLVALSALPRYLTPDLGLILFSSWYPVFDPKYLDLGNRTNLALLLLMIISGVIFYIFFFKLTPAGEDLNQPGKWVWPALVVGAAGLIFGLIPSYGAGYGVYATEAPINSRLALGAIPGAALIITALLDLLVAGRKTRIFMLALLVALLVGWHVRYTLDFRQAWSAQVSFYRQLSWRAPGLKAGTALVTSDGIFPAREEYPARVAVDGDFPTALAINVLYAGSDPHTPQFSYWYLATLTPDQGPELNGYHTGDSFSGAASAALVFTFKPQSNECLHILNRQIIAYRRLPEELRRLNPGLAGIDPKPATDPGLMNTILGKENTNTWCYYYEKADLAWQAEDWASIRALWSAAGKQSLRPGSGLEYLPFVEAFIHTGDWERALELTKTANKSSPAMGDVFCPLWSNPANQTQAQDNAQIKDALALLQCSP